MTLIIDGNGEPSTMKSAHWQHDEQRHPATWRTVLGDAKNRNNGDHNHRTTKALAK